MSRTMTRDLTTGNPMKLVISFAAPLLLGVLFQQLYSFVDTAIVGRYLGASRLAAVGATGSVNFLIIGLCLGFCSGFSIPIAQAFGAKNAHEVRAGCHAPLQTASAADEHAGRNPGRLGQLYLHHFRRDSMLRAV